MIYDISPVNNYKGNGSVKQFDYDFYIDNDEQIKVYFFDKDDTKVELVKNKDYKIDNIQNQNGGTITFPIEGSSYGVLQNDEKISIELNLPVSQETQYNNSSLLNLKSLEYSFDYLTRLIQILKRKLSLCIKVNEFSSVTPDMLLTSINNAKMVCENKLQELLNNKKQIETKIDKLLPEVENVENTLIEVNQVKSEIADSNMYKTQMFDVAIKDHILVGAESIGLELMGSTISGNIYTDFYNKCLEEKNNSQEIQVNLLDKTITMYRNSNGHTFYNIQDSIDVEKYYNSSGIAWYYGIDIEKKQIILPKRKLYLKDDVTVDENSHLYICVANNVINDKSLDVAGLIKDLSSKINIDHNNDTKPYLKEAYVNGRNGYNIFSNGFCEQWGTITHSQVQYYNNTRITFLKKFKDTNFNTQAFYNDGSTQNYAIGSIRERGRGNNFVNIAFASFNSSYASKGFDWRVCGYLAEGEY